jgi:hypothetical protein
MNFKNEFGQGSLYPPVQRLGRKVIDYSTAAGSRNQQTWLLDPCMRLTKFGKALVRA